VNLKAKIEGFKVILEKSKQTAGSSKAKSKGCSPKIES
jgi:hypothetical protein